MTNPFAADQRPAHSQTRRSVGPSVHNPTLSVLTPIYNGRVFVDRCYRNLLAQTFSDWEWVVIDDGSTDRTAALVEAIDDSRVRLCTYSTNRGRGYARMRGLDLCRGEWIVVWDVDDLHYPDRLGRVDEARRAGYDFCCSYAGLVDASLELKGIGGFFSPRGVVPRRFLHSTLACKRKLALLIGYDPIVRRDTKAYLDAQEDISLIITLSAKYRGLFIEDVMTLYWFDHDMTVEKSFASNLSAFRQLRALFRSGVLKSSPGQYWRFYIERVAKLAALYVLRVAPWLFVWMRGAPVRKHGQTAPEWVMPSGRSTLLEQSLATMERTTR